MLYMERTDLTPLSLEYLPQVGAYLYFFGYTGFSNIILILSMIGVCIQLLQSISGFSTGRMSLYASILSIPYFVVYTVLIFQNIKDERQKWSLAIPYMFNTLFVCIQLIGVASTYKCDEWYTCF